MIFRFNSIIKSINKNVFYSSVNYLVVLLKKMDQNSNTIQKKKVKLNIKKSNIIKKLY